MDANPNPTNENVINTEELEDAHLNCNEEINSQAAKPESDQECETEVDLPDVPYIKTAPKRPYTLVLDLDETLIHYNESKSLQQAHLLA